MKLDLLRKLPLMLSSTCASSDITAVTDEVDKAINVAQGRRDRLADARQILIERSRSQVEHHLGCLPRSKPLDELVSLVYWRSQRYGSNLSRSTVRKHLKVILS